MRNVTLTTTKAQHAQLKTARNRVFPFHRLLVALSLLLPVVAQAQFDDISINGVAVDEERFIAYQKFGIPAERYCHPKTDDFIIKSVIERTLMVEAARAAGYEASIRPDTTDVSDNTSEEQALYYRHAKISSTLNVESDSYLYKLREEKTSYDIKEKYLYMLATNNPLVVDVTMVRAARMEFNALDAAIDIKERLIAGEAFSDTANELGQGGSYYEDMKLHWQHIASLPEFSDEPTLGDLVGPYQDGGSWHLGQVLETKKAPVILLTDDVQRHTQLRRSLRKYEEKEHYADIAKQLWDAADIEINGKSTPYAGDNLCGDPTL